MFICKRPDSLHQFRESAPSRRLRLCLESDQKSLNTLTDQGFSLTYIEPHLRSANRPIPQLHPLGPHLRRPIYPFPSSPQNIPSSYHTSASSFGNQYYLLCPPDSD